MIDDPIIAEIRRIRDEHAARFDYDVDAIFEDIKRMERESGRTYVSFPPRRINPAEQEAARVRLQQVLEKEGKSADPAPAPDSPHKRLAS